MKINLKISIIFVSFIITLGILFFGQWLYKDIYFEKPLDTKLTKISGVKHYNLIEENGKKIIQISLGDIENLKNKYLQIEEEVKLVSDANNIEIQIKADPNNTLKNFWENSHFIIYEALEQKNFVEMANNLKGQARKLNIDECKIQMDSKHIYIQLHEGNNFLYKVIQIPEK